MINIKHLLIANFSLAAIFLVLSCNDNESKTSLSIDKPESAESPVETLEMLPRESEEYLKARNRTGFLFDGDSKIIKRVDLTQPISFSFQNGEDLSAVIFKHEDQLIRIGGTSGKHGYYTPKDRARSLRYSDLDFLEGDWISVDPSKGEAILEIFILTSIPTYFHAGNNKRRVNWIEILVIREDGTLIQYGGGNVSARSFTYTGRMQGTYENVIDPIAVHIVDRDKRANSILSAGFNRHREARVGSETNYQREATGLWLGWDSKSSTQIEFVAFDK